MPPENGRQQIPGSAADVDDRLTVGEFAGVGHRLRLIAVRADHRVVEVRRLLRCCARYPNTVVPDVFCMPVLPVSTQYSTCSHPSNTSRRRGPGSWRARHQVRHSSTPRRAVQGRTDGQHPRTARRGSPARAGDDGATGHECRSRPPVRWRSSDQQQDGRPGCTGLRRTTAGTPSMRWPSGSIGHGVEQRSWCNRRSRRLKQLTGSRSLSRRLFALRCAPIHRKP